MLTLAFPWRFRKKRKTKLASTSVPTYRQHYWILLRYVCRQARTLVSKQSHLKYSTRITFLRVLFSIFWNLSNLCQNTIRSLILNDALPIVKSCKFKKLCKTDGPSSRILLVFLFVTFVTFKTFNCLLHCCSILFFFHILSFLCNLSDYLTPSDRVSIVHWFIYHLYIMFILHVQGVPTIE